MRDVCAQCALPLGRRSVPLEIDGVTVRCCCVGCVIAHQVTRAQGSEGRAAALAVRLGLGIFFAMNVMMLSVPTYAPVLYGEGVGDGPLFVVLRVLALVLAAPVFLLLGVPIATGGWRGLRSGAMNADGLVVLGTVAAYVLSAVNLARGRGGVYFDTAATLLVLVTLGRCLEARARATAGAVIQRAMAPAPDSARRVGRSGVEEVPVAMLLAGDEIEVVPGGVIPTDGVVLVGTASIDEAVLTGESHPREKGPGAAVASGAIVLDGVLRLRVAAPAAASTAARIATLRDQALLARTRVERLADTAARRLAPAVVGVALAAGGWWTMVDGPARGILVALAVLVVACPCALGIATPLAIWIGVAAAGRRGIVLARASVLERLPGLRTILFDKTGTLTTRTPRLVAVEVHPGLVPDDLLARVAALEGGLGHPLARAVVSAAAGRGLVLPAAENIRVVPGRGVRGVVGGVLYGAGSPRFAAEELRCSPRTLGALGEDGQVIVFAGGRVLGALRFAEEMRPEAPAALAALRRLGLRVGLVSGDRSAPAVVPELVAPADAALGLLPEEKLARVREHRERGGVAMVGDGINDAPALASADIGVAVARACDLARLTADVVLLTSDLERLPWLVAHARRVMRIARQNLWWAFGYNTVAIGLAASGRLDPVVASLAMIGSSLGVLLNARRLARG